MNATTTSSLFVEATGRPSAIEDPSNRWLVHRASRWLLPYAIRSGIHPNAVSLIGMGCGALAGVCYSGWRDPWLATLGFALMIAWHICDGLDGQLARATGRTSALGRLLDGICDYCTFIFVLVPIALSFDNWPAMLTLAIVSGCAHAVQSAWYEGERESWIRRARGHFAATSRPETGGIFERGYNAIESALGNRTRIIDDVLAQRPGLLPAYLAVTAPLLLQLAVLGANGRTLVIWLACIAGAPQAYWLWELFGLSGIAVLMWLRLRHTEAMLCTD